MAPGPTPLVNLDTEAQLVTSQAVSSRAKVILQTPEIVGQLVQNVSVEVPANTNVLRINFTGSTAEEAQGSEQPPTPTRYLTNRRETSDDLLDRAGTSTQSADRRARVAAA